jgi:RNA-binding protein Nova
MDNSDGNDSRKRPSDCDAESEAKKYNRGLRTTGDVLLKQLVPGGLAGVILGKGGETIVATQAETGTVMKMSKAHEVYPGTTDRILLITGLTEKVRHAQKVIWERILAGQHDVLKQLNADEYMMKLVVPNVTVGLIIGRGGQVIKNIKEMSNAYVQVSQKSPDCRLVERIITIGGDTEQMYKAFDMILDRLAEDPMSSHCPDIHYADVRGPVSNASNPHGPPFVPMTSGPMQNPAMDPYQYQYGYGGYGGGYAMPQGMSAQPTSGPFLPMQIVEAMKAALTRSGYTMMASDEIAMAVDILVKHRVVVPKTPGAPHNFGPAPAMSLDRLLSFLESHDAWNGAAPGNGDSMLTGAGMYPPPPPPPGTATDAITREFQIAENIVGAVLGHAGRALVEIQRATGASIQLSKKGIYAEGTTNRIATVSGPVMSVERAIGMMSQCIQQEETKRQRTDVMSSPGVIPGLR